MRGRGFISTVRVKSKDELLQNYLAKAMSLNACTRFLTMRKNIQDQSWVPDPRGAPPQSLPLEIALPREVKSTKSIRMDTKNVVKCGFGHAQTYIIHVTYWFFWLQQVNWLAGRLECVQDRNCTSNPQTAQIKTETINADMVEIATGKWRWIIVCGKSGASSA